MSRMHHLLLAWATILLLASAGAATELPGFERTGFADEQQRTWNSEHGLRIVINAPGEFEPSRPTRLILYALPNGNSIEWTMGAKLEPGMDWHFDIQHVAAQVRKLRQVTGPRENVVVAYLEAEKRSWPAWRKQRAENGTIIRRIVREVRDAVPGEDKRLVLSAHSGGGSFIFGYLNGGDAIEPDVERIAWIDANYAYSDQEGHAEKLLAWLRGGDRRHLIVMAYDDRDVTLNGKNIVSREGGTYGRSRAMIERLRREIDLPETRRGEFEQLVGLNGRVRFLLHTNPQRKILHTVLVERNGLLEALTVGTELEGKWGGEFWQDRAYANLIAAAPTEKVRSAVDAKAQAAGFPPRPAQSLGGVAFAETIADLPPQAREAAIVQEITRGNVPDFLRKLVFIRVRDGNREYAYEVSPDYLAIGSDDDYVRMPMTPASAEAIARAFGCVLPTRKMVDQIYERAEVKLEPRPLTQEREAVRTFVQHNEIIEQQRARAGKPPGTLVAGHKKDVVVTNRLKEKPKRVAIYGWHKTDGKPIQPLYVGHVDSYVDYSHGIRLVRRAMTIDGKPVDLREVLRDPEQCDLLSDEGPMDGGYDALGAGS